MPLSLEEVLQASIFWERIGISLIFLLLKYLLFYYELQYQRAQMYVVMKMQQQYTTGNEGVEILENKSFDDDEYGQGQYTSKIYRLQR